MTRFSVPFWPALVLFCSFVLIASFVRWLDIYSSHYQACGQRWQVAAQAAQDSPYLKGSLRKQLTRNDRMVVGDKRCPALRPLHKAYLLDRLSEAGRRS